MRHMHCVGKQIWGWQQGRSRWEKRVKLFTTNLAGRLRSAGAAFFPAVGSAYLRAEEKSSGCEDSWTVLSGARWLVQYGNTRAETAHKRSAGCHQRRRNASYLLLFCAARRRRRRAASSSASLAKCHVRQVAYVLTGTGMSSQSVTEGSCLRPKCAHYNMISCRREYRRGTAGCC